MYKYVLFLQLFYFGCCNFIILANLRLYNEYALLFAERFCFNCFFAVVGSLSETKTLSPWSGGLTNHTIWRGCLSPVPSCY